MFYLLEEWFVDKENDKKVREILNEMNRDVLVGRERPIEDGIKKLEELGEIIIIEKINDGTIVFGA